MDKERCSNMRNNISALLIGRKGWFSTNKFIGSSSAMPRYAYELYSELNRLYKIDFIEIQNANSLPLLNTAIKVSSIMKFYLDDIYKRYNILHAIEPSFFLPVKNYKIIHITTVHDLIPIIAGHMLIYVPKVGYFKNRIINKVVHSTLNASLMLSNISILNAIKNSDYLLANSTQTKYELIKFGIKKSKIFITHMGIDNRFKQKISKTNKNKDFVIGHISGLTYRKNTGFLVNAFKYLTKKDIVLMIYGNKTRYIEEVLKNYQSRRIMFMGFAPEERIIDIYDSFDVFVFPSLYEGFGQPILEAQSRGLPVIIYKYGKIPKEVRRYCFEAESPEHMAQIIENLKENGYNEKEQKKAMEYARSFTWEKTAKRTLEVYKKVLE